MTDTVLTVSGKGTASAVPPKPGTDAALAAEGSYARRDRKPLLALAILLALCCGWILSLPVFPSQDGPVHVYYAEVTARLLAGPTVFGNGFRVAHALPPYSLHSYLLMLGLQWLSPDLTEKLLACLCVLIAGAGFLYFARQLGPSGTLVSVLAVPFFLHRYLFFGFYGYSMGIGFALLAIGIWFRPDRSTAKRRVLFITLAFLTAFTHPVPYLVLIACCASSLAVAAVVWRRAPDEFPRPSRGDVLALAGAACAALYIARYADSGKLWTRYSPVELYANLFRILEVVQMYTVAPLDVNVYRAVLRTLLLVLAALAVWNAGRELRAGTFTRAQLGLLWSLLLLLCLPFLPGAVNGSFVFAERVAVWPALLLLAAASRIQLQARAAQTALLAGVVTGVFALAVLHQHISPIARQIDVSSRAAISAAGAHALVINDSNPPSDLTFDPYLWAGVRVVEQEKGILINSPWLELSIMMLKQTEPELNPTRFISDPKLLVPRFGRTSIVVVSRCGADAGGVTPSVTAWLRSTYPGQWTRSQHACFDVLQPNSAPSTGPF